MVRDEAAALGLGPEVLCTRRDVEALVFPDRGEPAVLRGWRRAVIGEKLLAAKDTEKIGARHLIYFAQVDASLLFSVPGTYFQRRGGSRRRPDRPSGRR